MSSLQDVLPILLWVPRNSVSKCARAHLLFCYLCTNRGYKLEIWPWLESSSPKQEEEGKGPSFGESLQGCFAQVWAVAASCCKVHLLFILNLHSSNDHHTNYVGMQGQYSRIPMPCLLFSLCHVYAVKSTEYTEKQPLLSGVHSVMRVKLALAGVGGGCMPTPSHYIYHHQ